METDCEYSSGVARLPTEVWHLIAKQVLGIGSADDFENLLNSSKFFQNKLASLRTTYLFEKVFPLVASSVWEKERLEGMPLSEVLQLRGVCKHWNTIIDKLVNERRFFGEEANDKNVAETGSEFKLSIEYPLDFTHLLKHDGEGISDSIHEFLRHFESSHPGPGHQLNGRNPFIWRGISVETSHNNGGDDVEYRRFLEGVTTMLSKYGSHIHHFGLYNDGNEFSEPENVPVFQKLLSQMPNLKEFEFRSYSNTWWNDWESGITLIPEWEFPKYQRLEKLETDDLPKSLFNPLIRKNNHVSTLKVESVLDDYDFFTFPLPNLRHLKLGYMPEEYVEKMISSPEAQWPLESLGVEFADEFAGCAELFPFIQDKFSSTLMSLEISMSIFANSTEEDDPYWLWFKNCRLQLPKVNKVTMDMKRSKVCLDFLLEMKNSLEEITVKVLYNLPPKKKETFTSGTIVQFMGFEGKMLESNIWMLFKNLRRVEVCAKLEGEEVQWESRQYYREEWMLNNEYM